MPNPPIDALAVIRDAHLLDALGSGSPVADPTVGLLAELRDALDRPTLRGERTSLTLIEGTRHGRRWGQRAALVAGLAILVPTSGVAVAAARAHPGDLLYGVRAVVIGRTADDPYDAAALLSRAATLTAGAADTSAPGARTDIALSLVFQARARLAQVQHEKAVPLIREADELQARLRSTALRDRNRKKQAVRKTKRSTRAGNPVASAPVPAKPRPTAHPRKRPLPALRHHHE